MHEVSDLGIRIREIKLEITDVAEIFEDLNEGFLAIFLLDPIPDLLGSLASGKGHLALAVFRCFSWPRAS